MSKISELSDGGSLVSTDYLIVVRSGGNVKVKMDTINVDQVDLGDGEFIRLGNSQDLTLVHTSTQSIINQAGVGDLLLQKAGTTKASITANGLEFPDNSKAIFGAGSDLQIYHDGTHSYVSDVGTGNLILKGTHLNLRDANNALYMEALQGGAVTLRHAGNVSMATTATGIDVTGSVTADGLTVSGTAGTLATLDRTGSNGVYLALTDNSGSNVFLGNSGGQFQVQTAGASYSSKLTIGTNGDISFYNTAGTSQALFWDASAESLGIGVTDPIYPLEVQGEAGIELYNASGGGDVLNFRPSLGDANKYNMSISSYDHSGGGVGPADGISINGFDGVSIATGSSTARQERMRIDASGNVGINVADPTHRLEVVKDNTYAVKFGGDGGSSDFSIEIGQSGTSASPGFNATAGSMLFSIAASEAMRIDTSGNLLVGTTDTNPSQNAVEGIALSAGSYGGYFSAARSGGVVAQFARLTNDGSILDFRNSTDSVGSIGVKSSNLGITNSAGIYIASSTAGADIGIRVNPSTTVPAILPVTSANALNDDEIDLGYSQARFKDLYLSGGVYIGGTAAANKLDDYEEGTWTPTLQLVTHTATTALGSYTKVGNLVTAKIYMVLSSLDNNDGSGFNISLPFASSTSNQYRPALMTVDTSISTILTTAGQALVLGGYVTSSDLIFTKAGSSFTYSSGCNTSGTISVTVQYRAP